MQLQSMLADNEVSVLSSYSLNCFSWYFILQKLLPQPVLYYL